MPVTVVIGAQWGDEGKAKVIDLLAKDHSVVARYQGGHNAGHTVVVGTEKYALQLIPSGVFYEHVTPVIGNGVVVDLPTLFAEIDRLESRGISCTKLRVSSQAHLIFPWHQSHDAISEAIRGDDKIGTTLKGIGPAYADKARRTGIRAGEVLDPVRFADVVRRVGKEQNALIAHLGGEQLDLDDVVTRFVDYAKRLAPYVENTVDLLHDAVESGQSVLLEGAQATFLDVPVRHVVESHRGRRGVGFGSRSASDRPHRRDHQGLHHAGGLGSVPHRTHRCHRRTTRRHRS